DAVLMNPPYSAKWSSDDTFLDDSRFNGYGRLAPKSKADFAFLLHGLYHLKDSGTMAIVLPHGVLFRGAAEGVYPEEGIGRWQHRRCHRNAGESVLRDVHSNDGHHLEEESDVAGCAVY